MENAAVSQNFWEEQDEFFDEIIKTLRLFYLWLKRKNGEELDEAEIAELGSWCADTNIDVFLTENPDETKYWLQYINPIIMNIRAYQRVIVPLSRMFKEAAEKHIPDIIGDEAIRYKNVGRSELHVILHNLPTNVKDSALDELANVIPSADPDKLREAIDSEDGQMFSELTSSLESSQIERFRRFSTNSLVFPMAYFDLFEDAIDENPKLDQHVDQFWNEISPKYIKRFREFMLYLGEKYGDFENPKVDKDTKEDLLDFYGNSQKYLGEAFWYLRFSPKTEAESYKFNAKVNELFAEFPKCEEAISMGMEMIDFQSYLDSGRGDEWLKQHGATRKLSSIQQKSWDDTFVDVQMPLTPYGYRFFYSLWDSLVNEELVDVPLNDWYYFFRVKAYPKDYSTDTIHPVKWKAEKQALQYLITQLYPGTRKWSIVEKVFWNAKEDKPFTDMKNTSGMKKVKEAEWKTVIDRAIEEAKTSKLGK